MKRVSGNLTASQSSDSPTASPATGAPANLASTLVFGLEVLLCYTPEQPVLGIAELSDLLDASRSTVHRHARTLVELGFLKQEASRKYRLGSQAHNLGLTAIRCSGLSEMARPWLAWLRATTGLTASLGILDGDDLVYTAWLPSCRAGQAEHAARRHAGWSTAPHTSAAGKALLAFAPEEQWPAKTRAWAVRRSRDRVRLLEDLRQVSERGYATSGAWVRDRRCGIAAPILGASQALAAVELSVLEPASISLDLRGLAGPVNCAAQGITEQLEESSQPG